MNAVPARHDPSDLRVEWARLCALLDDDPAVAAEVDEACDSGVDQISDVLIGALDDAGALAYLHIDDSGVELADALEQLPRIFGAGIDVDPIGDAGGPLEDAIRIASRILAPSGLALVHLVEDQDAVPLVVVRADATAEIVAVAGRLGQSVRVPD